MSELVNKVIATGFTVTVGLADDRQIVFQSGFEGDEDDAVVHARVDRLMAIANRQQAISRIPALQEERAKVERTLAQMEEDSARVETKHEHEQALRRVEIDERKAIRPGQRAKKAAEMNSEIFRVKEIRDHAHNSGVEEHQRSGRGGSYAPRGAAKSSIERMDRALDTLKKGRDDELERWDEAYDANLAQAEAEIAKADAERDATISNLDHSVKRHNQELERIDADLTRYRALVGT